MAACGLGAKPPLAPASPMMVPQIITLVPPPAYLERDDVTAVREAVRIVLSPGSDGVGLEIELEDELAALLGLAQGGEVGPGLFGCLTKLVAGAGNQLDLLLRG